MKKSPTSPTLIKNDEKQTWFGDKIYRYKLCMGKQVVYWCVTTHLSQDAVIKQLEADYGYLNRELMLYCNGEKVAKICLKKRKNLRPIKCRETGKVYDNVKAMMDDTDFDYKHCIYLITRTTRYNYIED